MSLLSLTALNAIEQAINAALIQDQPSQARLSKLAGQRILVEVEDFSLLLLIQILDQGLALGLPSSVAEAELDSRQDTHVSGPSSAYRKLLDGNGFFDGDLRIQGNAQTLMTLHKVSENFELDWEGMLADKIGDLAASVIAELLRTQWTWSRNMASNLSIHLVDYLQNDSDLLPSKAEFNNLVDDLERLSSQLDRLEARTRLLERKP